MGQTLQQKRHRKLKKIAERDKSRIGKNVIFTDRVEDTKKKKQKQDWNLIGKYQQVRESSWW